MFKLQIEQIFFLDLCLLSKQETGKYRSHTRRWQYHHEPFTFFLSQKKLYLLICREVKAKIKFYRGNTKIMTTPQIQ